MECTLCKIQCIRKADPNAIPSCRHFSRSNHDFKTHAKFTVIETITNRNKSTEVIQDILRKRKNFWINTLETLYSHGLNQELNP